MENVVAQPGRRRWLLFGVPLALFLLVGVFLGDRPDPRPEHACRRRWWASRRRSSPCRRSRAATSTGSAARTSAASRCWSTCSPPGACRAGSSIPIISRLAEQGVVVQGINYKDRPEDAKAWLGRAGRSVPAPGRRPRRPGRHRLGRVRRAGNLRASTRRAASPTGRSGRCSPRTSSGPSCRCSRSLK